MKGVASRILIALGIVFILAAILWWAIAVNSLVKLPDKVEVNFECEGDITLYQDLQTQERFPEGGERRLSMRKEISCLPIASEFSDSTGVLEATFTIGVEGMTEKSMEAWYVLDRKSVENIKDDRAFSYRYVDSNGNRNQGLPVDRVDNYFPLLPMDTSKDGSYLFWKEETGMGFTLEFINEEEKEGVTVYNFSGSFTDVPVNGAYLGFLELPQEMTQERVRAFLASAGVDTTSLISQANRVMSPEDLQTLNQALQGNYPLNYFWSQDMELSVEPKSGRPVDVYKDVESLSVKADLTRLTKLADMSAKYAQDPVLGPAMGKLQELRSTIESMSAAKVFEYNVEQTDQSVKESIEDAKEDTGAINLYKVYIPWALLIVGSIILIIGLLVGGGGIPQEEEEIE
jgi:hypothetical protein